MSKKLSHLPNKMFLYTKEIAKFFEIKQQTLRKWISKDNLPAGFPRPRKMHGRNYWLHDEVVDYILLNL